mmetsp:Transcript_28604/g.37468  ORF Transcript_28604/g.37468 Transcript_28604/m.37468 type:complete len:312 (-) Transcript_28604:167-1102(-)
MKNSINSSIMRPKISLFLLFFFSQLIVNNAFNNVNFAESSRVIQSHQRLCSYQRSGIKINDRLDTSSSRFNLWEHYFPDKKRPSFGARISEALGSTKRRVVWASAAGGMLVAAVLGALVVLGGPKVASAAGAAGEKLHLGHKIANSLRAKGFTDELIVLLISAVPAVELRGSIPVGAWLGLPLIKTFWLSVVGNMLPIMGLLGCLKSARFRKLMDPLLKRAASKSEGFGDNGKKEVALALFVGVPFPGTGAWTGAFISLLLDMGFRESTAVIFAGVLIAGAIVTGLTFVGREAAVRSGVTALGFISSMLFA